MHPEVRQLGPGNCPKCGMALEPLMQTQMQDDSELRGREVGVMAVGDPLKESTPEARILSLPSVPGSMVGVCAVTNGPV